MISGMRVMRRSGFKKAGGYKFYRLWVTQSWSSPNTQLAELNLVTPGNPSGVPSGGSASASAFVASFPPANAFDNDSTTRWVTHEAQPQWLQYELAQPEVLTAYRIQSGSSATQRNQAPTDWQFQGSHDGINFDVLDTQTGIQFVTSSQVIDFPL